MDRAAGDVRSARLLPRARRAAGHVLSGPDSGAGPHDRSAVRTVSADRRPARAGRWLWRRAGYGSAGGRLADTDPPVDDCDTETLGFANMRLRLMPTVNVSDTLKVHAWIDVFDNMVLGSTPDGYVLEPASSFARARSPFVPIEGFTTTAVPPTHLRNSLGDSIVARRAWAEVTNRDLGQLRFGRMGSDWGLGILANGGEGLDD